MRAAGRVRRRAARAAATVAAGLALAGCGESEGGPAEVDAVPADSDCVQSWNGEKASLTFGRHVYSEHDARQGRVTVEKVAERAPSIRSGTTCAVVFAVAPTDYEYGDVGLAGTRFGWASMREIAPGDSARADALQDEAAAAPNVDVFPDGTISPR